MQKYLKMNVIFVKAIGLEGLILQYAIKKANIY